MVFGAGARASIGDELTTLAAERVLVVTGGAASIAARAIVDAVGDRVVGVFDETVQHVPEGLARRAGRAAVEARAAHLVSVGGGSATGLAKAVAVEHGIPILAVPTTYAGSEMTPIWGVTGERKRTGSDDRALPVTVVYDPELTLDLPVRVSAASGMNALAHAVAAVVHEPTDPIAVLLATDAIRGLLASLPAIAQAPDDADARARALYSASLAARSVAATGVGLHHRLAHVLGGRTRLVHADLHAVLLPHTIALLEDRSRPALQRLSDAMASDDPAGAVAALAERIGAPTSLAEIGVPEDVYDDVLMDLDADVDPRSLRALLLSAHRGGRPRG